MRIRTVDAFTDRPFAGNPAGVCVLAEGPWPQDGWMQAVAMEMNLAETAFVRPASGDAGGHDWDLRWFSPTVEVPLCGHATLATAHALAEDGLVKGIVRFGTLSGVLSAEVTADGSIVLDLPANPPVAREYGPEFAAALGVEPVAVFSTGALGDVLVELADEQTIRTLTPDLAAVARIPGRGVIVTAAADDPSRGYDYVLRVFAPQEGIPEDPVTGSSHTTLAPLWTERLGRAELVGFQASARTGLATAAVIGDRVRVRGRAVTVLDGTLAV